MRKESAVVLWWASEIRLLTPEDRLVPVPIGNRADPGEAILRALSSECPQAAVRIIYHPESLEVHPVTCPPITRSRLRAVLAGEHPAVSVPDAIWSVEPVRSGPEGSGHSSLLYIDHRSRLPRLIEGLGRIDVRLEGIWPWQTLIEGTVPCDGPEFIAMIAVGERSLVSCLGPSGARYLRFQEGADKRERWRADATAGLALFEGRAKPAGLVIAEDAATGNVFQRWFGEASPSVCSLEQLLGNARRLRPGSFSDFLARKPFFARRPPAVPTAAVAGLILLFGSTWSIHDSRERAELVLSHRATSEAERIEFARMVESRRKTKEKIERLTRSLDLIRTPAQHQGEFLLTLAQATPATISLESLSIAGENFLLSGRIHAANGLPNSPLAEFRRKLGASDRPWHLAEPPPEPSVLNGAGPPPADSVFTIRGTFASSPRNPDG